MDVADIGIVGSWTVADDVEQWRRAMTLARGPYQRNLLRGCESLSGSTLKGKAREWSSRYHASRTELLARLRTNGIAVSERTGAHGKRILVIGEKEETMHKKHRCKTTEERPFSGSVAARQNLTTRENPAAHGHLTLTDTCACGATREKNVNGRQVEYGAWTEPAD